MLIYVVRHGETDANLKGYLQGQSDDPLNGNGRRLAEITGRALQGVRFDGCISSPLSRARETAEIILRESGNAGVSIEYDRRIMEISMGSWERKPFRLEPDDPAAEQIALFLKNPFLFAGFPGGEDAFQVCRRTQAFLMELAGRGGGGTYLVTTHGFALRAMLNRLYDDPTDFWHGHVPYNCVVNIIEADGGHVALIGDDLVYYDRKDIVDRYSRS